MNELLGERGLLALLAVVRSFGFLMLFPSYRGLLGRSTVLVLAVCLGLAGMGAQASAGASGECVELRSAWSFVAVSGRELGLGLLLALPFALFAEGLRMGGRLIDVGRGAQFGEQLNPAISGSLSPLETTALLWTLVLVFTYGGYQVVFSPLLWSFQHAAVGGESFGALLFLLDRSHFLAMLLGTMGVMFRAALQIAAPVLLFCFLLDMGSCVVTRMLGRVNMMFEMMPLKLLVGLSIAALSVSSFDLSLLLRELAESGGPWWWDFLRGRP